MFRQRLLDPADLLDLQIAVLEQQHQKIGHVLGSLRAAQSGLTPKALLTIEAICGIIKLGEEVMTDQAWKPVWDKYYTPEEQEKWKTAKQQFTGAEGLASTQHWADLISRIETIISQGIAPDSDQATTVAKEWYDLQKPMVDAVGTGVWNKGAKMYEEMNEWQTDNIEAPFSLEVYDFIVKAADAARPRNIIPPRMAA